jgi:hypothetical protein
MMTCHVRSKFTDKVMRDINRICKSDKYGIYHTTIQVEKENKEGESICCDHNCWVYYFILNIQGKKFDIIYLKYF